MKGIITSVEGLSVNWCHTPPEPKQVEAMFTVTVLSCGEWPVDNKGRLQEEEIFEKLAIALLSVGDLEG